MYACFHVLFLFKIRYFSTYLIKFHEELIDLFSDINFQNFHVIFPKTALQLKKILGISSKLRLILNQAAVLMV